ncbi:hypothetical protein BCR44DRAFT_1424476 [Catenaria anguillulae PL171]|uniref:Uncharacterized protein n=1 Tax=Catenaria anguillulae PL171 TaxID=765915 RepID=A0A1Y2HZW4_9FUNG|nr:hypothetical protein BCR44DRAFT_1424476 [Catenaria anguillulae PL171]
MNRICNRYPPRHHSPCLAATQSHLHSDPSGPAPSSAIKLPATSVAKITAFLLKAKPVNVQDANKRSAHVSKRIARAMVDAAKADSESSSSSASTTATSLAAMQVLMDTRFAPVLLYDDDEGKLAARALEASAQSGQAPLELDLDAFSAHAIVRTVSGVFTCYDSEAATATSGKGPTPCDMQTLHRLIQLVDVLTAWLDSVRARAPMAAQLEAASAPTLAHFVAGLKGDRDQVTARAIILDLVTSTARTLLDVYYLPLHYYSARRPGHASEREAREAAWRAMARVQTLGEAVRKTRAEYPFWFG